MTRSHSLLFSLRQLSLFLTTPFPERLTSRSIPEIATAAADEWGVLRAPVARAVNPTRSGAIRRAQSGENPISGGIIAARAAEAIHREAPINPFAARLR